MKNRSYLTGPIIVVFVFVCGVFQTTKAGIINAKYGKYSSIGAFGGDGGQATAASLNAPKSCFVNTHGVAYIADRGNYRIRKVDAPGIISSLYGSSSSAVIGTKEPFFVTGDTAGNIYFASDVVYKIVSIIAGVSIRLAVSIIAGGGTLGQATGSYPDYTPSDTDNGAAATSAYRATGSLWTDTYGDLYIADALYNKIKKVSISTGILTYVAGTGYYNAPDDTTRNGDGGPATSAKVKAPVGLFIDSVGDLFFSGTYSGFIRKIDLMTGIVVKFAGGGGYTSNYGDGGPVSSAQLPDDHGSFVAGDRDGNIYYLSIILEKVRVIDTSGFINTLAGTGLGGFTGDGGEATAAKLSDPSQIFVRESTLFLTDTGNNVVRTVGLTLTPLGPTVEPSEAPSCVPTTITPTALPTFAPSIAPTTVPSAIPTLSPTLTPSLTPTTVVPTLTFSPSMSPTATPRPSLKPSNRPSVRPSRAGVTIAPTAVPTLSPTAPIVAIVFNSSLYLHNVSASSLDLASQSAVTSSVAVTLNISNDQVSYVSQQLVGSGGARRQLVGVVRYQVMMTVTIAASTADFADAVNQNGSYLYSRLTSTLADAVESNDFTRTVRETSAALGALATLYVGYVNLTVFDFTDVTLSSVNDDSDDSDSSLSGGAIAGIVIGGVIASVLLLICVYFAACRESKKYRKVVVGSAEKSPA